MKRARNTAIEMAGRHEFVVLVGTNQKQAGLAYGDEVVHRPLDLERRVIGSFYVPWP